MKMVTQKQLANLKPVKPGDPSRNPGGRPKHWRALSELLRDELAKKHLSSDLTNYEIIVQMLVAKAVRGDQKAAELVLAYAEGKPAQSVALTGLGGGPVEIKTIEVRLAPAA
jgi:hypothetical protein